MTSSMVIKQICTICEKNTGIWICAGCKRAFCSQHTNEHRQLLGQQMDKIILACDELRQSINDQMRGITQSQPMKEIDECERQSNAARQEPNQDTVERVQRISTAVQQLAERLKQAYIDDDFVESDLRLWSDMISKFQIDSTDNFSLALKSIDNDLIRFISQRKFDEKNNVLYDVPHVNLEVQKMNPLFTGPNYRGRILEYIRKNRNQLLGAVKAIAFTSNGRHHHPRVIQLKKTNENLGFILSGGREDNIPVFISQITPNGIAWKHGGLKQGDQLLFVNGVSVKNTYHQEAVELLKQVQGNITLVVRYSPEVLSTYEILLRQQHLSS